MIKNVDNMSEVTRIGYALFDLWVKAVGIEVLASRDFTPDTWVKVEPYLPEMRDLTLQLFEASRSMWEDIPGVKEVVLATYARDRQRMREQGCPEHVLQALAPQVF